MTEAEFDIYADEYYQQLKSSIGKSGEDPEFFAEYKVKDTLSVCEKEKISPKVIFDFGAGIGNSIPWFRKYFPTSELICADISAKSMDVSKMRFPGNEIYLKISESGIDLPNNSVDVVFCTCVFHHIDENQHVFWLNELNRILKKDGLIIIFEHNPYNPLTVSTVKHCPFDVNAKIIKAKKFKNTFALAEINNTKSVYRIFFPKFLSFLRPIEKFMKKLPLGAQYYLYSKK